MLGNGNAIYTGGFFNELKYKGISLSILFDYNFGNNIYRNYDVTRNNSANSVFTPDPKRIDNAWVRQGDVAGYPSLEAARVQNRIGVESNYVGDGDYIKLRNIRVNYILPKSILNRAKWVNAVSINASVNNLLTWTNYIGYNPELGTRGNPLQPGFDNLRYPNKTDFIIGLRAQF